MARSTYIYVVMGDAGAPIAAFTVKHELKTWLTVHRYEVDSVWRIVDGRRNYYVSKSPTVMTPEELT